MVQFSWFFTVTEADTAIWGKKKSGNYKATKDYSQSKRHHLFFFLLSSFP